jgi:hypothetical protein
MAFAMLSPPVPTPSGRGEFDAPGVALAAKAGRSISFTPPSLERYPVDPVGDNFVNGAFVRRGSMAGACSRRQWQSTGQT